jgi:exo-beta-1,3-glucanase (GH17 family)
VAPKACTVFVHDLNDTAHQLDVTAETLYEAVAQALAMVRGHDWVGDIGTGLTTVTVKVRNPEITHIVKMQDFENWLKRGCKSPADTVLKTRLRRMLGMREQ